MTEEDFKFYRAIVGFRNILVHGYTEVNLEIIEDILRKYKYRRVLELAEKIYNRVKEKELDP